MTTDHIDDEVWTDDTCFGVELPVAEISVAVGRSVVRRVVVFRDDDAQSSFMVALTEILTNAVDEHRRRDVVHPVRLYVTGGAKESVTVLDAGGGFDSSSAPSTVAFIADPPQRGRGLALARAFVPMMTIESTTSGTVATLPLHGFGIVR